MGKSEKSGETKAEAKRYGFTFNNELYGPKTVWGYSKEWKVSECFIWSRINAGKTMKEVFEELIIKTNGAILKNENPIIRQALFTPRSSLVSLLDEIKEASLSKIIS